MGEVYEPTDNRHLERVGEETLLRELTAARRVGDLERMRAAISYFVQGRYGQLLAIARLKLPDEADAEDMVGEAIISALDSLAPDRAGFDGAAPGELAAWLIRILKRRIADHFRRQQRQIKAEPLDRNDDDDGGQRRPIQPLALTGDPEAEVMIRDAHERILAQLAPHHRAVIELWWNERLPAPEIVEKLCQEAELGVDAALTVDNVHQIISRYRRKMRQSLELVTD